LLTAKPDALREASWEHLATTHPGFAHRRWNPDLDWQAADADEFSRPFFARATPSALHASINEAVNDGLIRALVSQPWERVFPSAEFARILGVNDEADLNEHRARLLRWTSASIDPGDAFDAPIDEPMRAKITSASAVFDPNRRVELLRGLGRLGVELRILIDASPTPVGRSFNGSVERLTRPYFETLGHLVRELSAITSSASNVGVTFLLPEDAIDELAVEGNSKPPRAVLDFPPYSAIDLLQMIDKTYFADEASRFSRLEFARSVPFDQSIAISTAAWMLSGRVDNIFNESGDRRMRSGFWYQEEFDEAIRGLAQMIGLPTSIGSDHEISVRLLAGLHGGLPRRDGISK
jgi:hypothetical protein